MFKAITPQGVNYHMDVVRVDAVPGIVGIGSASERQDKQPTSPASPLTHTPSLYTVIIILNQ